jgi:hypothetical protein
MKIVLVFALLAGGAAHAGYVCKALPQIPGATYQQIFEINNANQIAAGSDVGSSIYAAGGWTTLPVPAGYAPGNTGALGINDAGDVAGAVGSDDGSGQLFIFSGGAYQFASFAPWLTTQARAINNAGIATGLVQNADGTGTGFVYNPRGSPLYPPGFTVVAPPLPDGSEPWLVIAAAMNDAGQFVGNGFYDEGNWAFFYDPATGQYTLFQINGWPSRARGLNNRGDILAESVDPDTGLWHNFIVNAQGTQEVTCPNLPQGAAAPFMVGINDARVISISSGDASAPGGIAFPDAASALSDLIDSSAGAGPGKSLSSKARAVADAAAAGDTAGACAALAVYEKALKGKHVDALQAASLASEAAAIGAELNCQ